MSNIDELTPHHILLLLSTIIYVLQRHFNSILNHKSFAMDVAEIET